MTGVAGIGEPENEVLNCMGEYKPPFHMTDTITNLVAAISEQIGQIRVVSHGNLNSRQRKENRIRTIHSSLAIEHNSLSLGQVTAIVDGKRILGNPNEIREVKNAYEAYERMLSLDPYSVDDLLKAHGMMMQGLILENGIFRSGGWGVRRRCGRSFSASCETRSRGDTGSVRLVQVFGNSPVDSQCDLSL